MAALKLDRLTNQSDRLALKAATRRQCAASGRLEAAAMVTRVTYQTLHRYGDPQHEDQFIPLDVVVDLTRDSGQSDILAEAADQCGYVLVPKSTQDTAETLLSLVGAISRESGDVVGDVAVAISDGTLDEAERAAIGEGIRRAMEALCALERCVAQAGKD